MKITKNLIAHIVKEELIVLLALLVLLGMIMGYSMAASQKFGSTTLRTSGAEVMID